VCFPICADPWDLGRFLRLRMALEPRSCRQVRDTNRSCELPGVREAASRRCLAKCPLSAIAGDGAGKFVRMESHSSQEASARECPSGERKGYRQAPGAAQSVFVLRTARAGSPLADRKSV